MGMYIAYAYYGLRNFDVASTERGGDLVLPDHRSPERSARGRSSDRVHRAVHRDRDRRAARCRRVRARLPPASERASTGPDRGVARRLPLPPVRDAAAFGRGRHGRRVAPAEVVPSRRSRALRRRRGADVELRPPGDRDRDRARARRWCSDSRVSVWQRARPPSRRPVPSSRASRPDRLGFLNWIIATVLAGLAVIVFAATSARLDPTETSLLVVPALAAALLGRVEQLRSHDRRRRSPSACSRARSARSRRAPTGCPTGSPTAGLRAALPVVLIVVAITLRGARLPDARGVDRSPSPRRARTAVAARCHAGDLGGDGRRPAHARRAVAARDRGVDDRNTHRALGGRRDGVRRPDLAGAVRVRGTGCVHDREARHRGRRLPVGAVARSRARPSASASSSGCRHCASAG